jgi:mono/diheme cytochrome c family protein
VVARPPPGKPPAPVRHFRFAAETLAGKGERLLDNAKLGGPANTLTCISCHGVADERSGIFQGGHARPNRTLFDAAKRPTLWQGIAKDPGKAASLCVRLFMLNPHGLTDKHAEEMNAYLAAIAPNDAVPGLDYEVLALTRRSTLANPTRGNRKRGEQLTEQFCGDCHGKGKIRPPLTVGLYEASYLVQRVRWLPGHDAKQMPPIYVDRLVDSDLRHIVTYLAGDESKRIFQRKSPTAQAPTTAPGEGS